MVYRDGFRSCPVCGDAFEEVRTRLHRFHRCDSCSGIWLEWATFLSMWAQMSPLAGDPPLEPRVRGGARERNCPSCENMMDRFQLRDVPVDRCQAHGVWFDRGELETSLAAAILPPEDWFQVFAKELLTMS